MIKNILKLVLKIIGALFVVALLIWALSCTNLGAVSDAARDIRNTVVNYFFPDKQEAEQAIRSQAEAIAEEFGWDVADVQEFLEKYHIEGMEVIPLPDNAVVKKTVHKTIFGTDVTITVFRDPGYITLDVEGHVSTVSVPEKAQKYISLWGLS